MQLVINLIMDNDFLAPASRIPIHIATLPPLLKKNGSWYQEIERS